MEIQDNIQNIHMLNELKNCISEIQTTFENNVIELENNQNQINESMSKVIKISKEFEKIRKMMDKNIFLNK